VDVPGAEQASSDMASRMMNVDRRLGIDGTPHVMRPMGGLAGRAMLSPRRHPAVSVPVIVGWTVQMKTYSPAASAGTS
jgi:hypothetical protein